MFEDYQAKGGKLSREAYEAQLAQFRDALPTHGKAVVYHEILHAVYHAKEYDTLPVILGEIFPE